METSILQRLNRSCERYADKVMFKDEHSQITFAEFNRLTKAVGSYLAAKVPCGAPVAVMSGRHILTPACFLGAVRAGCFYAPMDGDMPQARLNQILGVIKAEFMLVDKAHLETAQSLDFNGELIVLEDIADTAIDEALIEADSIIISISQVPRSQLVNRDHALHLNERGRLQTDDHGETTMEGVFASGDVVTGAKTVVAAVAVSKQIADNMDAYMQERYGNKAE